MLCAAANAVRDKPPSEQPTRGRGTSPERAASESEAPRARHRRRGPSSTWVRTIRSPPCAMRSLQSRAGGLNWTSSTRSGAHRSGRWDRASSRTPPSSGPRWTTIRTRRHVIRRDELADRRGTTRRLRPTGSSAEQRSSTGRGHHHRGRCPVRSVAGQPGRLPVGVCLPRLRRQSDRRTTLSRFPYTRELPGPGHSRPTHCWSPTSPARWLVRWRRRGHRSSSRPPSDPGCGCSRWLPCWQWHSERGRAPALELDDDGTPPATAAPTTMPMATPTNDDSNLTDSLAYDHDDNLRVRLPVRCHRETPCSVTSSSTRRSVTRSACWEAGQAERLGCFDQEDNQEIHPRPHPLHRSGGSPGGAWPAAGRNQWARWPLGCSSGRFATRPSACTGTAARNWCPLESRVPNTTWRTSTPPSSSASRSARELPEGSGSDHHHDE